MKKLELLAPAGNMASLIAAIEAGCDAIYLGGHAFGARSFAGNFSDEEIIEAVNYAHLYGVKIYVTVNTIIYEDEVKMFLNYVEFLHNNNVDAVILQDIGMLDLIRQTFPNLEVHASTQMHIHNAEGVKLMDEMGVERVVLARETSIDLIKEIKAETKADLEIFVHGALCISYSGQCLMSSLVGGRSGNRGTCAQSCRQKYSLISDDKKIIKDEYLISPRDLNTLNYVGELIDAGVTSLKIEGRMKRPEYVYYVVSLYRKAIDSYLLNKKTEVSDSEIKNLKLLFNRKFTKGFLNNEENNNIINRFRPNHQGVKIGYVVKALNEQITIKLTDDLSNGDGVRIIGNPDIGTIVTEIIKDKNLVKEAKSGDLVTIKLSGDINEGSEVIKTTDKKLMDEINNNLKKLTRKIELTGNIILKENKPITLTLSDGINEVTKESSLLLEKAKTNPATNEDIKLAISKLGGTVYQLSKLNIIMDTDLFVSKKELNELRRLVINELTELRLYNIPFEKNEYKKDVPEFEIKEEMTALIDSEKQFNELKDTYDYIYMNKQIYDKVKSDKAILKLPRVIDRHNDYNDNLLIGELGSLHKYKKGVTDFSFNVVNSYAVAFLHSMGATKVTLSHELTDEQMNNLLKSYQDRYQKHPNIELIIYGKEEAMVMKYNLLSEFNKEASNSYLEDRFGNKYPLEVSDNLMYIYNYKPKDLRNTSKYFEMGINSIRYDFRKEN